MKRKEKRYQGKRSMTLLSVSIIILLTGSVQTKSVWAKEAVRLESGEQSEEAVQSESSEQKMKTVRYSEIYDRSEDIPEPDTEWTDAEGNRWVLCISELLSIPITGRSRVVSGEIVYPGVTKTAEIPEQAVMEVDDKESGQVFEVKLPLNYTEYQKERWEPDLEFTATFHSYGADTYRLGELQIPHQSEQPPLDACGDVLLAAAGLEEEDCRIEKIVWNGESYTDAEGICCRDAKITGSRRLWDCRAVYEGKTELPDVVRYRMKLEYQMEESAADTGMGEMEEYLSEGENKEDTEMSEAAAFWQKLIRHGLEVSVSLVFLCFLLLGFRALRKRAAVLDRDGKN